MIDEQLEEFISDSRFLLVTNSGTSFESRVPILRDLIRKLKPSLQILLALAGFALDVRPIVLLKVCVLNTPVFSAQFGFNVSA